MQDRPSKTTRFPCFDGLRAIAALSVVGVHTTFPSGLTTHHPGVGTYTARLEIGVAVFFVISGFLLYRPFAKAHLKGAERPATGRFWIRRLKRIVPAYWLAFLVISYVIHADQVRHGWAAVAVYLGFAQIYSPYYILSGVSQAWSLCTEMSFYLALPLWAWAIGRRRRRPEAQLKIELLGLGGWLAVSFGYRVVVLSAHGGLARSMPSWLPGYADLFAFGMLLAVLSAWFETTGRSPAILAHRALPWVSWTAAAGLFVAVSNIGLSLLPISTPGLGVSLARQTLYGLFGLALVLPAVVGPQDQGAIRRLLSSRPMIFLGTVSYGIYLWHEAWITEFIRWTGQQLFHISFIELVLFTVATAVATAAASYAFIERPILRGPSSRRQQSPVEVPVPIPSMAGRP